MEKYKTDKIKILLCSDIHNNFQNLQRMLQKIENINDIDFVINTGDFTNWTAEDSDENIISSEEANLSKSLNLLESKSLPVIWIPFVFDPPDSFSVRKKLTPNSFNIHGSEY